MLLTVNPATQDIVQQPGVASPVPNITVPRAAQIPIVVQFTDERGTIIDPEATTTDITSSSVAAATVVTCPFPHGLTSGDSVTIADHTGVAKAITAVAISSMAVTMTVANPGVFTTPVAHALAVGDTVVFTTSGTLPTNIVSGTTYFVKEVVSTTTFKVSAVSGGTAIDCSTGSPTTTHTATFGTAIVSATAHGLASADIVDIADINGVVPDISGSYTIRVIDANNFTVPVAVTSPGAGGFVTRATSTPDINGTRVVTVVSATTFTVPVTVTTAGEGGTVTKITPLALRWTVKADGQFDGPTVATCNDFTKTGSGSTAKFTGTCNYITTELNSLLGIDPVVTGTFTVTGSSTTFTSGSAHGLTTGDAIVFETSGTIPTGLVESQTYYLLSAPTSTTFTIGATAAGSAISPTSTGSGTLNYTGYPTVDDVTQATLMAELRWTGATPSKTNWVTHYVRNDLYKTDDPDPITANGSAGRVTIASGLSEKSVVFSPALSSANWHFLGAPVIFNTTASALGISFMGLTAKSASGFTAILSGATDATGTYQMEYSVRPD